MKRISIIGLCLAAVFALSAVAASSALATPNLLWEDPSGNFPVSVSGSGGEAVLETTGGKTVKCTTTMTTGELGGMETSEIGSKFAHLFLLKIKFLKCNTTFFTGGPCKSSGSNAEEILVEHVLGHLGLAHHGTNTKIPGILLLIPANFEFECEVFFVKEKVGVSGQVIGEITNPEVGKLKSSYNFKFKQTKGKQELQEFLVALHKELLTGQHEMSKEGSKAAVESAQEGEGEVSGTPELKLVESEE